MTICDKIRTVGDTLETNLNARGVSCTFGTGTGEKTILDMVNLITSSNLKGSSDAVISISASRPYLLSGEKTDLIVRLADGLGQPLANKSVSISDGTSVYNGLTNLNGIFTLYNVSVSGDTTFTATYSTVSATCKVEYCTFIDYGVDSNNNSTNMTLQAGSRTITDDGTLLQLGSAASWDIRPKLFSLIDAPFEFEFLVVGSSGRFAILGYNSSTVQVFSFDTGNVINNGDRIKVNITSTEGKLYRNDVLLSTKTFSSTTSQLKIRIYFNQANTYLKYKDFRIRAL